MTQKLIGDRMSESFEIVVFKQEIGKEDKKRYDLVSTKSFLDGEADLKVKKEVLTLSFILMKC